MDEYCVPDWLPEAARETDAYVRQLMPHAEEIAAIAQRMAPLLRQAQENYALIELYLPFLRDLQARMEEIRQAVAIAVLPTPRSELVRAMDAGMRELLLSTYQTRSAVVHGQVARVSVAAPMGTVVVTNAAAGTDMLTVQKTASPEAPVPLDAKTVFLAIMWVFLILLSLGSLLGLPAELLAIIAGFLGNVSLGLIITWRVNDSRRH
jgi:hypothetical protein